MLTKKTQNLNQPLVAQTKSSARFFACTNIPHATYGPSSQAHGSHSRMYIRIGILHKNMSLDKDS